MSHEYTRQAIVDDCEKVVLRLVEALGANPGYEVLGSSTLELTGRFSEGMAREQWPEDFTLSVSPVGVYLALHSGSSHQRSGLVRELSTVLDSLGLPGEFEEE